jgi:ubiquinone/menaquinone biosynthesis C-methylase UbiE
VPQGADLGLGCGAPLTALKLQPGETVLDLGAGGGLDAFIASPLVGEQGRVVGVDMTTEMIERARRNASEGGYANVEFRQGRLESLPLGDAEIDAITSNCVVNLVPDKQAVFREAFRVLKPGGRIALSDILLDAPLPEAIEKSINAFVGCISGATPRERYFEIVKEAGFTDIEILNDTPILEKLGGDLPADARELLDETGVDLREIKGAVRSVTFRAHKPE